MQPMFKLLAQNRNKGFFRAEASAKETTVYLYDAIVATDEDAAFWGGVSAETVVKTLRGITTPTIRLRVNSPGGDVFAARAIEQAMRDSNATIIAHIDGYAASAASFLVMAADKILIAKGAFMMIHKAWTMAVGNADDMLAAASLLEKIDSTQVNSYAARSGGDPAVIAQWMTEETWFTADEAISAKLADSLAEDAPKNASTWNMSAYSKAPAAFEDVPPAAKDDTTVTDNLRRRLRLATQTA